MGPIRNSIGIGLLIGMVVSLIVSFVEINRGNTVEAIWNLVFSLWCLMMAKELGGGK